MRRDRDVGGGGDVGDDEGFGDSSASDVGLGQADRAPLKPVGELVAIAQGLADGLRSGQVSGECSGAFDVFRCDGGFEEPRAAIVKGTSQPQRF